MDMTHSVDMTGSSETYIHASKSTDFIKPKDSSNNLETHNQGNGDGIANIRRRIAVAVARL